MMLYQEYMTCQNQDEPCAWHREDGRGEPIVWYAKGGGVRRGPFRTQLEATEAMRLAPNVMEHSGPSFPYPRDMVVWCERADSVCP